MAQDNPLLKQIKKEIGPDGKGEMGPPPEPPGPSAQELIKQGLSQKVLDAEKPMIPIIEQMTAHAKAVRALRDRTSQWDSKGRQETTAKVAELRAKYEEGEKQLHELKKTVGIYSQSTPFLKAVYAFANDLERHFTEEVLFVLNRF